MRGRRLRAYDRRLHAWIGALPATPADRWLRRLSLYADHGKLWLAAAGLLSLFGGKWRRAAIRGVAAQGVSRALTNVVLKHVFGRGRPDMANLQSPPRLPRAPRTPSLPPGDSSPAPALAPRLAPQAPA